MSEVNNSTKNTLSKIVVKTQKAKTTPKAATKVTDVKVPLRSKINVLHFNSATGRAWIETIATRLDGSRITKVTELCTNAYTGRGLAKNNPYTENHKGNPGNPNFNAGTIPRGEYRVHLIDRKEFGPLVFRLTPTGKQEMHGRDGFLIHGDGNATRRGEVSQGCVIMPHTARQKIAELKVNNLIVEPEFLNE